MRANEVVVAPVLAVYSVRGHILALSRPDWQKIRPDGVNGQHNARAGITHLQVWVNPPTPAGVELCWPFSLSAPTSWHSRVWTASESLRME